MASEFEACAYRQATEERLAESVPIPYTHREMGTWDTTLPSDVRPSQEIDPPGGLVRGRKCFAALSSLVGFEGLYVGFGVLAGGARREEHLAVRESGAVSTQTLQRKTLTRPCRIYTDCKERI